MTSLINARRVAAACTFAVLAFFLVAVSSAQAAPNLILNPGVETSTIAPALPDNWAQGGFGSSTRVLNYGTAYGHTGKGVSVTITNYVDGDAKWYFDPVLFTPTSGGVEGGAFYTFSDWYKSDVTSYLVVAYAGSTQHPDKSVVIATLPATNPAVNGGWAQASTTFASYSGYGSMTVYHLIQSNGTLTTDDYSLERTALASQTIFDKGIVSLTFDDGLVTQYSSGYLNLPADFKATFYIIGKIIGQAQVVSGYFGSSTMRELQTAGHEIGGHTQNHCNLVMLANDPNSSSSLGTCAFPVPAPYTYQEEVTDGLVSIAAGGANPVNTFAYPNGATNEQIKQYLQSDPSLIAARTITEGYNTKQSDRFALQVQVVSRAISTSTIKGWIDTAVANKFWLILVFHQIDTEATLISTGAEGGTTPEKFQETMAHLQSKGSDVEVLTVRDALARMGVTPPPSDTTAPVITLTGAASTSVTVGGSYTDAGATATDNTDASVSVVTTYSFNNVATSSVNTNVVGTYTVRYNAQDVAGNTATEVTRVVNVVAAPVVVDPTPTPTPTPTPAPSSGGGGGGGGGIVGGGPLSIGFVNTNPTGSVLGAQTGSPSCYQFLTTLQVGSTGTDVVALQTRLTQEGLFTGTATGYFGSITKAAVMAFQQKYGVSPVGIVGPQTRAVLNASCAPTVATPTTPSTGPVLGAAIGTFTQTLMQGSTGAEVTMLQKVLIDLGFLKISTPTGFFGSLTKAAVMGYQSSRGIEAVGIVGPKTRQALNNNAAAVQ